jgi:hypothetical protein
MKAAGSLIGIAGMMLGPSWLPILIREINSEYCSRAQVLGSFCTS